MDLLRKKDSLFYLSLLMFLFWIADFYNKAIILHAPFRILWYSSSGLLITAVALFIRNSFLITSMFCALFVIEGVWNLGFFSLLIFHKAIPGVAEYAFTPNYPQREFIITLYHLFLAPSIILALIKTRKYHKYGWLGASIFALTLGVLTYILVDKSDNINCVHSLNYCQSFLSFLDRFNNPERLFLGVLIFTFLIYFPLNYFLIKIGSRLKWQEETKI